MGVEDITKAIDKFWESIPPAWFMTRYVIRSKASHEFHLTVEQFQVLRRIRKGIVSVSELAKSNQTSRSSVSRAVDALVNKGLVARDKNPKDRRYIPLSLTKEGERVLAGIYDGAERWLHQKFEVLDPSDLKTLISGMNMLIKVFKSS